MVRLNNIIFERTRVVIVVPYSSHIGLDISIIRSPENQMIKEGTRLTYNCAHLRSTKESLTDSVKKFFVRKFFCVNFFWVKICWVNIF